MMNGRLPDQFSVRISVRGEDEHACIDVVDTGVGIDAATLPRIFQLFRQGGGKRQRESGLGLGLTITKHLIELHEGSVQVSSDGPGRGATFTIMLPALVAPLLLSTAGTSMAPQASERLPPSRVLVVDDQQEMREVTVRLLRSFGAEVVDVIDATSALAQLEKEQFDLVVSDIMMPGVDGMEFARALRERHGSERPLLALTALSGGSAQEQAREAGFSAFLTKPVTRNLLYRTVHDLLGHA